MDVTGLSSICVLAIPYSPNLSAVRPRALRQLSPSQVRARGLERTGVVQFYQTRRAAAQLQYAHRAGLNLDSLKQVQRHAQIESHRQLDRVRVAKDGHHILGVIARNGLQ